MSGRHRTAACISWTLASTLAAVACGDSAPDTVSPDGGPLSPADASTIDSVTDGNSDTGLDGRADSDSAAPHTGTHVWSKIFGDRASPGVLTTPAIATDTAGNVLVAGAITSAANFGGDNLVGDNVDIFIAKFTKDGVHVWSKSFGDAATQSASSIAVDPSGSIFVGGNFRGTIDLGGGPITSAGGPDAFVAKFDKDGNHVWSKGFGDPAIQNGLRLATVGADVVLVGANEGTVDFGGGPLAAPGYNYLVRLSGTSGAHVWSKQPSEGGLTPAGIAIDSSGGIIVVGALSSALPVNWGDGLIASAGGDDVIVLKFDSSGTTKWTRRFGDAEFQDARAVGVDPLGNILLTGRLYGALDFGTGPVSFNSGNQGTPYVAKLSPGGAGIWSKAYPVACGAVSCGAFANILAVDSAGNIAIGGTTTRAIDFGGGVLPRTDDVSNIFIAKLDGDGLHLWSKGWPAGASGTDGATAVAFDAAGNVLVAASLRQSTIDMGGGPLATTGSSTFTALAKFNR